eukprot:191606_1
MDDQKQSSNDSANIYDRDIPNSVVIDRNRTISYYINLCAKILTTKKECIVTGAGNNCDIALSLVAALQKRKLGKLTSIRTGMDVTIQFTGAADSQWQQPSPMMTFKLCQGPNAKYISGYRQKKIIQIFEKHDSNVTGRLSIDKIKSFNFQEIFMANDTQKQSANKFISQLKTEQQHSMSLPDFIKY